MDDRRFDDMVKALTGGLTSRRFIIKGLGALLAGSSPALGGIAVTAKPHHKKKGGKKHGGKNGGGQGGGKGEAPVADCDAYFASEEDRTYCRFIRRQCDGEDIRPFCIIEGDPADPAKVAVCCNEFAECCGHQCCGGPSDPHLKCCNGACTNLKLDDQNCGACGKVCEEGQVCQGGNCVCVPEKCPHGQLCFDNRCGCGPFFKYCPNLNGGVCTSPNAVC